MEGTVPEKTEQNKTQHHPSKLRILRDAAIYLAKVAGNLFLESQIIILWSHHDSPIIIIPLKY